VKCSAVAPSRIASDTTRGSRADFAPRWLTCWRWAVDEDDDPVPVGVVSPAAAVASRLRSTGLPTSRSRTPTRQDDMTEVPRLASQVARVRRGPAARPLDHRWVSVYGRMGPLGVAMTSSITSPKRTMRVSPSAIEQRPLGRNFSTQHAHICARDPKLTFKDSTLGCCTR